MILALWWTLIATRQVHLPLHCCLRAELMTCTANVSGSCMPCMMHAVAFMPLNASLPTMTALYQMSTALLIGRSTSSRLLILCKAAPTAVQGSLGNAHTRSDAQPPRGPLEASLPWPIPSAASLSVASLPVRIYESCCGRLVPLRWLHSKGCLPARCWNGDLQWQPAISGTA